MVIPILNLLTRKHQNSNSKRSITKGQDKIKVLDVGSSTGRDLLKVKKILDGSKVELWGIDCNGDYVLELEQKGIKSNIVDIEHEKFPFNDSEFDLIICNQVIEHTKEIFWIFSELCRILKIGGYLIVGVPNLSAFHNCFLLMIGRQPLCLKVLGPHVRGYTYYGFKTFVEVSGELELEKMAGSNFYPFSALLCRVLCKIFPLWSSSLFFLLRRKDSKKTFLDIVSLRRFDTNYFTGN